eukprot:TRINITY_DN375_c1_g1_i1.p1 TRINITY_DN375_c1_g1~~TRINITY_DN375_c1_g1_i1.p1  ORF type:complete len:153 (+),score=5.18 TRINITY_DN375_c1_g1_i1:29-460(+)
MKPHYKKLASPFSNSVYELVSCVPPGKVVTYKSIADGLGSSARAVGQALRNNPFAPIVPCHRVISSSMEIGGFNGNVGDCADVQRKRELLISEGVEFTARGAISPVCVYHLPTTKSPLTTKSRLRPGTPPCKKRKKPLLARSH